MQEVIFIIDFITTVYPFFEANYQVIQKFARFREVVKTR